LSIEKVPRENSNDFNPLWVEDTIYFLSDRNGPVTLFAYNLDSKEVKQVVRNEGLDFKSASAGPGGIVIEQFGALRLYEFSTGQTKRINVNLTGDLAEVRPRFKKVETKDLVGGRLSPTGQRAVFEVRGEIVTVPAEKGDVRNLTRTPNTVERDPAWSPDGKWIAYFSEESGEYALHLRDQTGLGETRKIALGDPPSFFYSPTWSPDSKKIAYTDKRGNLWWLDFEKRTPVRVDTNTFGEPIEAPEWSPDNQWLAYAKLLPNRLGAIFVYGLETKKTHQITDGMSDAAFPAFDPTGKYLYFAASTDSGPANGWGDLSSINRPVTRSPYLIVLDKTLASPLVPESDEEKIEDKKDEKSNDSAEESKTTGDDTTDSPKSDSSSQEAAKKSAKSKVSEKSKPAPVKVKIDFDNLNQRILALPMPAKNYHALLAGKSNIVWLLEGPAVDPIGSGPPEMVLQKFDLAKRKAEKFLEGLQTFSLSHNREKILYKKGSSWFIVGADQPPKDEEKALNLAGFQLPVDPRQEWRQMYREVWRIERDFLYDPGFHGLNLQTASRRYEPYLDGLASRADLNYLFEEMLGELTLGHVFVDGGDMPVVTRIAVGLLGADYRIENERYRFARIYGGENWNPQLRAPLTEPGVNVAVGDYLLAVDGRSVPASQELYSFFLDKADKLVTLRVGPNPDGTDSREIKVKPVSSDHGLRNRAWIEDNRRKVDELSQGRLAYVYLPDTHRGGYENFNRYFFAQVDKQGFIIDERFNGGGLLADYVIDYLRRPIMNYLMTREGEDISMPLGANPGPKVMIINQFAGSGGDALPWYFRKAGIGKLVGKRTWGGLVGWAGSPPLLDGGWVGAPSRALYGTKGEWEVENIGIAPDIEVELEPKAWSEGHDLQLEKAVEVALDSLKQNPPQKPKRPAYPNYQKNRPAAE
jgi:tricorn protease